MSRRASGEGSVSHRADGRWVVSFSTGIYLPNGKPEKIYRYGKTQQEAISLLQELQVQKQMGVQMGKSKVTAGEYMNDWIERRKAPKLAPATLTSYRNNFRLHIQPAIGKIALKDLTSSQLQRMLKKAGGSYSKFVKIYNIVHGALEQAVKEGIIMKNPCIGVSFPKDDREKMRVLSMEEERAFIKALEGAYYRPLFLTFLLTGMRLGEALPLTWADIDIEERHIVVKKKAIVYHDYASHSTELVVEDFCKTKSSTRSVVITKGLAALLTEHKRQQVEQMEKLGQVWNEQCLVFPNTKGKMPYNRIVQISFNRLAVKAGIEGATVHTLRHTYATRCFESDMDYKTISAQLGHASVKTTIDTYVHLIKPKAIREVDKLAKLDQFLE